MSNPKNINVFSSIKRPTSSFCKLPIDENKENPEEKGAETSPKREIMSTLNLSAYDDVILASLKEYYRNEQTQSTFVYQVWKNKDEPDKQPSNEIHTSKYDGTDYEAIACMTNDNSDCFQDDDKFDDVIMAIMNLDEQSTISDFSDSSIL